jgi:hypothetical protein
MDFDPRGDSIRDRLSDLEAQVSTLRTKVAELRGALWGTYAGLLCQIAAFVAFVASMVGRH